MITLVIHHRVRDYDVWKAVFDEQEGVRRGHGQIEHRLYRYPGDPNGVAIHNDFPSGDAARGLLADTSLKEAMARGGVEGEPGSGFLALVERKTYSEAPNDPLILVIHHRVEDYAAWKSVFDENEDLRRSHGGTEHRLYQDPYEFNRVVIHIDFPSEKAALGFRDDPSLGQTMARAGVVGEPGIGTAVLAERKVYADQSAV